ncbi:MAG: hypothetical protein ACK5MD_04470 [Flavobacteriales bacterium]
MSALATKGKAVTFNATGLSDKTKSNLGIADNKANISAYVVFYLFDLFKKSSNNSSVVIIKFLVTFNTLNILIFRSVFQLAGNGSGIYER